jgi:hypothetical protein
MRHHRALRTDAVFGVEELLEVVGEGGGEFLPGQELQSRGEGWTVYGGEDGVPGFNEVVAAGVGKDRERCAGGVGREDVADELVAGDEGS